MSSPRAFPRLVAALLLALALAAPCRAVPFREVDRLLALTVEAVEEAAREGRPPAFPAEGLFQIERIDYPDGGAARVDLSRLAEAAEEISREAEPKRRRKPLEILAATLRATREELAPEPSERQRTPDEVRDALERAAASVHPVEPLGTMREKATGREYEGEECTDVELSGRIVAARRKPSRGAGEAGTGANPGGRGESAKPGGASGARNPLAAPSTPPRVDKPRPRPKEDGRDRLAPLRDLFARLFAFAAAHLRQSLLTGGACALLFLLYLVWRSFRGATRPETAPDEAAGDGAVPLHLADPTQLRAEALRLSRAGDRRGAVRLFLVALLSLLDERRVAPFDPSLTNGDYLRLLRERASCREPLREPLARFDAIVYGGGEALEPDVAAFDAAFRALERAAA